MINFAVAIILFVLIALVCGVFSENARRDKRQDNDEYDYGHNAGNYHSDGEGEEW